MPSKCNMKNNPKFASKLWSIDSCQRIDSQSYFLWCPFFAPFREGKDVQNDTDLVEYFKKVFEIREEMESNMNGSYRRESWLRMSCRERGPTPCWQSCAQAGNSLVLLCALFLLSPPARKPTDASGKFLLPPPPSDPPQAGCNCTGLQISCG